MLKVINNNNKLGLRTELERGNGKNRIVQEQILRSMTL